MGGDGVVGPNCAQSIRGRVRARFESDGGRVSRFLDDFVVRRVVGPVVLVPVPGFIHRNRTRKVEKPYLVYVVAQRHL
jgi:hypothetical protein